MGKVIFLMGVSSTGKTTVSHALQELDPSLNVVGFDHAVERLDKKYWPGGSNEKEGFYYIEIESSEGKAPKLCWGQVGEAFLESMIADIIKAAKADENLIIDSVLSDEEHQKLLAELSECNVVQIGLKPPLEEVIKREEARGDRKNGLAKATYENFYLDKHFDLEIDTKIVSGEEAAKQIMECLNHHVNKFRPAHY